MNIDTSSSDNVEVLIVPDRVRNAVKLASVIPLYVLWFLLMIVLPVAVVWAAFDSLNWNLTKLEAKIAVLAIGLFVPCLPLAIVYALKYAMSQVAASMMDKFLVEQEAEDTVRRGINKKVKKHFWFDSVTMTVPTPYRRIIIVGNSKSSSNAFCVMDVGSDFRSLTLEHYLPGEQIEPPLTRTKNPMDGYRYYGEWLQEMQPGFKKTISEMFVGGMLSTLDENLQKQQRRKKDKARRPKFE